MLRQNFVRHFSKSPEKVAISIRGASEDGFHERLVE
jgi:hypothetical protein